MSLVEELIESRKNLLESVEGLTDAELSRPQAIGEWSVRDILLHIAMWEGEVLKALAILRAGGKVDWAYIKDDEAIDKFNEFWLNNTSHLSARQVVQMFDEVHAAIVADVSEITDKKKIGEFPGWLRQITVDHNQTHIRKIAEYRRTLGK